MHGQLLGLIVKIKYIQHQTNGDRRCSPSRSVPLPEKQVDENGRKIAQAAENHETRNRDLFPDGNRKETCSQPKHAK